MIEDDQKKLFEENSSEENPAEESGENPAEENPANKNDGGKKSVKENSPDKNPREGNSREGSLAEESDENPANKNDGKKKGAKEEFEEFLEKNFEEGRYFYGYFLQENFLHRDLEDEAFQNEIEKIYGELKGGESCEDEVWKIYKDFEGTDLPKEIVKKYFDSDLEGATSVCLKSIEDVQDVNALHGGEKLFFVKTKEDDVGKDGGGKKEVADGWDEGRGLAIVYGDNASGKSGYVRILKNACSALIEKGKNKDREILPNVYGEKQKDSKPINQKAVIAFFTKEDDSQSGAVDDELHQATAQKKTSSQNRTGGGDNEGEKIQPYKVSWKFKNGDPRFTPIDQNRDGNDDDRGDLVGKLQDDGQDEPQDNFDDGTTIETTTEPSIDKKSTYHQKVLDLLKNIKIFDADMANVFIFEGKNLEITHPSSKALVYLIKVIEQLEEKFDGDIGQKKENDGKKVDVVGGRRDKLKKNFDGSGSGGGGGDENFKSYLKEAGKCFYAVEKEITFSDTPENGRDFVKTFFSILGKIVDLNYDSSEEEKLLDDLNSDDAEKSSAPLTTPLTTEGNEEATSSTASSVPLPSEVKNPEKKLTVKEKLKLLARLICELKSCCSQSGDQLLKKIKENALQKNAPAEKILLTQLTEKMLDLVKDYPQLNNSTAPTALPEPSTQIAQDQLLPVNKKIVDEKISKGAGGSDSGGDAGGGGDGGADSGGDAGDDDGGGGGGGDTPAPETPKTSGDDSLKKLKDLVSNLLRLSKGEEKEIKEYEERQKKDAETIRKREKEKQELKNTFEKQKKRIEGIENHVQDFYGLDNSADDDKSGDVPFLETSMGEDMGEVVSTLRKFFSAKEMKDALSKKMKMSSGGEEGLHFFVGSNWWLDLWHAAKQYSERVAYYEEDAKGEVISKHQFPHTGDDARCVLCQQTLQEEAKARFKIFKEFVEKEAFKNYENAKKNYKESLESFFKKCKGFLGEDIFKRLSLNSGKDKSGGGDGGDRRDGTIDYLVAKSVGEADGGSWSILGGGAPSNGEVATQSDDEMKKVAADLRGEDSWEIEPAKETAEQSVQSGTSSVNGEAQKGEPPKKSPPQNVSLAEAIGYLYDEKLQEDLKTISKLQKELMEKSSDDKTGRSENSSTTQDPAQNAQGKSGQDSGPPLENPLLGDFLKEDEREAKKDERKNFKEAIKTLGEDYEKYFNEKLREPVFLFLEKFENCLEKFAKRFAAKSAQQPAAKSDQECMPQDDQDDQDHHLSEIPKEVEEIKIPKEIKPPKFLKEIVESFQDAYDFLENEKDSKQPAPTALIALQGLSDENFAQKIQDALKKLNEVEDLGKRIKDLEERKEDYIKSTKEITDLSKKINKEMIGEKQKKAFEDTLEKFDLDYIKLKQDIIGEKGMSKSKINFESKKLAIPVNPHEILSGGEFRGVAFAAFFAEMAVRKNKSAIVFDDPVSSMDHTFSGKIADCLVEEAKSRQVIVFTHNQFFEEQLVDRCGEEEVQYIQREIAKPSREGFSGYVLNDPSFERLNLEDQFKWLENEKKNFKEEDFENWNDKSVRLFTLNMRRWLEKFVREGLKAVGGPRGINYGQLKRISHFVKSLKKEEEFNEVKEFCNDAVHYTHSLRKRKKTGWDDLNKKLKIIEDHFLPIAKDW